MVAPDERRVHDAAHADARRRRHVRWLPRRHGRGVAPGCASRRVRRRPPSRSASCSRPRSSSRSGLLDDLRELSAPAKVAGMVLAGGVLSLLGVTMFYFRVPFFGLVLLSPDLAPLVTVLWVVGHGERRQPDRRARRPRRGHRRHRRRRVLPLRPAAQRRRAARRRPTSGRWSRSSCSGMCVGFLPHNFHPARIFMGDGGALLLGLLMAASTIVVGGRADRAVQRPDLLLLRPAVHPARHPRGADPRHDVRDRAPGRSVVTGSRRPTRTTCTTG